MLPGNSTTHLALASKAVPPEPIAIVGMACRFPRAPGRAWTRIWAAEEHEGAFAGSGYQPEPGAAWHRRVLYRPEWPRRTAVCIGIRRQRGPDYIVLQ